MATKRKADDNIAEDSLATRGRQRQRLEQWNHQINDDIMLQIFKFLPFEDLNSIAVLICRRYRDLRNHESLDQTRTSTIVCSETTTSAAVRNAFNQRELNQAFSFRKPNAPQNCWSWEHAAFTTLRSPLSSFLRSIYADAPMYPKLMSRSIPIYPSASETFQISTIFFLFYIWPHV
jgi:hypothetical protein